MNQLPQPTNDPQIIFNIEMLYNVIDAMNRDELEELQNHLNQEIELREYKASRVAKIKQDISLEKQKLRLKMLSELEKDKKHSNVIDDEYSSESSEEVIKPRRRATKGRKSAKK